MHPKPANEGKAQTQGEGALPALLPAAGHGLGETPRVVPRIVVVFIVHLVVVVAAR
jgi:hypothetical protein